MPLHQVNLASQLITGKVVVGVCSSFPVPGVSFILPNDLAEGKVFGNRSIPSPVEVSVVTPVCTAVRF